MIIRTSDLKYKVVRKTYALFGRQICLALFVSTLFTSIAHSQFFPARQVFKLFEVYGTPWQGLGTSFAGNFDLNRDGKPDFAVGTFYDTTLIYFGGKNVLDTLWDLRIKGGQNAIVTGDFDGDGLLDIVTSGYVNRKAGNWDFGAVYFFHGIKEKPYIDTLPVTTLVGDTAQELGKKLLVADINGDGISDLIVYSTRNHNLSLKKGILYLLLGGASFPTTKPIQFYYKNPFTDTLTARYAEQFSIGDINGDSLSDLIVWSNQFDAKLPKDSIDFYLEIFYGKKDFSQKDTIPEVVFHRRDYPFLKDIFSIVDLNGDHIDDICFMVQDTLLFQLGTKNKLTKLGPFEHIVNPDATRFNIGSSLFRIGDFNGDGYEDFMTIIIDNDLPAWYFTVYLCGPHWYTIPAYYYLYGGFNVGYINTFGGIGDVNGDGGKEFIITRDFGENGNDPNTVFDGDFIIVRSDTLLKLNVNDLSENSIPYNIYIYPNPLSSLTTFTFTIPKNLHVQIAVYDLLGRKMGTVVDGELEAGNHTANFDGSSLPTGIYFCKMTAGDFVSVQKMMLSK